MTARVACAVLRARLHAQRRMLIAACAAAIAAGLLAPPGPAGIVLFCTLLGIGFALAQSPGLHPHLDRCEQSAPLFGRELARAKALVPCVAVTLATSIYAVAQLSRGAFDTYALLVALPAVVTATLVAISATMRGGASRALYVLLAVAASAGAYAIGVVGHSLLGELAFCVIVAFFAVRQYGETLARYDPI